MTPKQKAAIKFNIKQKFLNGEITQAEYDSQVKKLQTLAALGATLQEANTALGMYKSGAAPAAKSAKPAQTKPAAKKAAPITNDELFALESELAKKLNTKLMTSTQYLDAMDKLQEMYAKGKSVTDANMLVYGSATPPQPGMSIQEFDVLKNALVKKKQAGLITQDEYKQAVDKLTNAFGTNKKVSEIEKEIGCDPGTLATDESVIKLGKEFKKVYGQAAKEMKDRLDEYLKKAGPEIQELEKKLADGTITEAELKHLKTLKLQKEIMGQKVDQLTGVMTEANKKALGLINGEQAHVFAENANYQAYQLTQDAGLNLMFSIYDQHTADRLLKEHPELLPRKEDVNGKKDKAWNQKIMANAILQGVIQGDSIPKLAKRIAMQTGETNMKAMTRYARTAMTAAQNGGRMDMLHQAQGMGISVKKVWMATLDSRTRDSHAHLDGKKAEVDEKFPNGLMYPGDPNGAQSEVYNCRCTLVYDYEGFPHDPVADQRLMYDEWDEEITVKKKDKNGKEYETKKIIHHRESKMIQNMPYDEWAAAKKGSKLNDLNVAKHSLAEAQKAVIKAGIKEDKVYEGLWKDPVTLADYPAKKAGIQAKLDYYDQELDKYKQAQADGYSWATDDKIKELEKKKKLLKEFEKRGELIEKRDEALKAVQDIYTQVGYQQAAAAPAVAKAKNKAKKAAAAPGGTSTGPAAQSGAGTSQAAAGTSQATAGTQKMQFAPDAWDEKTKRAAPMYSSREEADQVIRPDLDADWDKLSDEEKYAVWEYTRNSNPMNKSLSGYHETWSRSNYIGPSNTEWGHEDRYRTIDTKAMQKFAKPDGHVGYKKAITDLTLGIEKTPLKHGMWLVRGSDENGFAGMMEGGGMNFNQVKSLFSGRHSLSDIKKALVGQTGRNHAFTSTGIAKNAGFGGNISYEIYAPAGTKCIYAEPQSYYGSTSSDKIYKKGAKYRSVGGEAEIIVQRGTAYRISDIKQRGSGYTVVMEIVEQPDYFVNGDEDTYNGGKTRHKR